MLCVPIKASFVIVTSCDFEIIQSVIRREVSTFHMLQVWEIKIIPVLTGFVRTEMEKLCWLHSLEKLLGLNTGSNHRADRYQEFITRRIKRKTERWATSPGLQPCGSFVNVIDFSVSPESCFYLRHRERKKGRGSDSAEEKITIWVKRREEWRRMKRDSHLHRYRPNQIAWIHHCILRGRRTGDEEWSAPITAWYRQIQQ